MKTLKNKIAKLGWIDLALWGQMVITVIAWLWARPLLLNFIASVTAWTMIVNTVNFDK